jgi:AcrR family transcriptional regulator
VVERVLKVVGDEIGRVGPDRVRMGRVAELSNVSRASLYRYFASKDELIMAYTMRELDRIFEGADQAMEEYDNFEDRLCAAFTYSVLALDEHHAFQALLKFGEWRVLQLTLLSAATLNHARDLTVERINGAVGAGRVRFDPFDAAVAAEVIVRLCVSLMATPDSVARFETRDDTFAFCKRYVVPMVYALGAGRNRNSGSGKKS